MSAFPRGRVVITGGAGLLGWHLARALDEADLLLFDREPLAQGDLPEGAHVLQADVRDRAALRGAFAGARAVIHAAAALPRHSSRELHAVNVEGARAALDVARDCGVERVVHVSATSVYGPPNGRPMREEDPLAGVGPYAESKIRAEILCRLARERGQCVTVLRPKTFVGAERLGAFHLLFEWIRQGRRIPLVGDGSNRYQLLAVEDMCAAVRVVLELPEDVANDTFNVGAVEFGTVAEDLCALLGHAASGSRLLPTPPGLAKGALRALELLHLSPLHAWIYRTADQDSVLRTEKLQALGWRPTSSNAAALTGAYDWYVESVHRIGRHGSSQRSPWREGMLGLLRRML